MGKKRQLELFATSIEWRLFINDSIKLTKLSVHPNYENTWILQNEYITKMFKYQMIFREDRYIKIKINYSVQGSITCCSRHHMDVVIWKWFVRWNVSWFILSILCSKRIVIEHFTVASSTYECISQKTLKPSRTNFYLELNYKRRWNQIKFLLHSFVR